MAKDEINFNDLAKEAQAEAYNPRARRCWPWSHEWTMWETDESRCFQWRRCVGCGKVQQNVLAKSCTHLWLTQSTHDIYSNDDSMRPVGVAYMQRCIRCGDVRRKDLRRG